MATSTKAKKTSKPKAAPRAALVDKEPTQLHEDFVEYIRSETGYEDVDPKSVQLAVLLRMDFQRSDINQARLRASKEAKAKAEEERAAKRAEKQAAKSEKAEQPKKAPAKKAAAAKSGSSKKTAAVPAKKAPTRAPTRRSKAKASTAEEF